MTPTEKIIAAMPTGENNGKPLEDLTLISGLSSERATRRVIEDIRRSGIVICSSEKGYYYPADADELRRYVNKERCRSNSIAVTLESAESLLAEWGERA